MQRVPKGNLPVEVRNQYVQLRSVSAVLESIVVALDNFQVRSYVPHSCWRKRKHRPLLARQLRELLASPWEIDVVGLLLPGPLASCASGNYLCLARRSCCSVQVLRQGWEYPGDTYWLPCRSAIPRVVAVNCDVLMTSAMKNGLGQSESSDLLLLLVLFGQQEGRPRCSRKRGNKFVE